MKKPIKQPLSLHLSFMGSEFFPEMSCKSYYHLNLFQLTGKFLREKKQAPTCGFAGAKTQGSLMFEVPITSLHRIFHRLQGESDSCIEKT